MRNSTVRKDRKIIRSVERNCEISANDIKEELNLTVFKQTFRNRLKECAFNSCFTMKKNFVSEKNRKLGLDWAKKYCN